MTPAFGEGRVRAAIEDLTPQVDGGRFPVKRTVGERVVVEADVFADGHDALRAELLHRREQDSAWTFTPMTHVADDRWRAAFRVRELGRCFYTVRAWVDPFLTWRRDLEKRVAAGQEVQMDLRIGAGLLREIVTETPPAEAALGPWIELLEGRAGTPTEQLEGGLSDELLALAARHAPPHHPAHYPGQLAVQVDPVLARFGAWYELFPRSTAGDRARHGTFHDVERLLPYVAELGFDVLYLPPIHPIGQSFRKGPNNSLVPGPEDPGSPWAIGAEAGGHTAIHPQLGSPEDFRRLVAAAREHGLQLALDIAFQTSPDHPWVREHPDWFKRRPDGSIQYAENPPKKYQDIYPLDFETADWRRLWSALRDVFEHWLEQGVSVFRVDNPHTKSLAFWEWCLGDLKARYPEAIFLSEAFTRPKVMRRLAKAGFTQSYTYFPWRVNKHGLTRYLTELTQTPMREYFRPNQWPNTPDILPEYLQNGGRPAFLIRLVLAATLGASYGIYGPAFELCESRPVREGSEEYLDSEKYQLRAWDLEAGHSLRFVVQRVNRIRRDNPALHSDWTLRFHHVDNEQLICFSKSDEESENVILVVVNLDPHHRHSGWLWLDLGALGLESGVTFQAHDLLSEARFLWENEGNYVDLDPLVMPAHVFVLRKRVRTEADFEYFV
jgi:starch synthase (maltosyl-transferring)